MIDYSLGKIYKIVGNGKVYVGSTTRPLLSQRFAKHKNEHRYWIKNKGNYMSSYECLTDPECFIELIEAYPCSCKDELLKCESKWIREIECINKTIPSRTKKEWIEDNEEKIKEQVKIYYEANKEKIKEYKKEYQQKNKEAIAQKKKEYRENKKNNI
jgi:hypothetical protein